MKIDSQHPLALRASSAVKPPQQLGEICYVPGPTPPAPPLYTADRTWSVTLRSPPSVNSLYGHRAVPLMKAGKPVVKNGQPVFTVQVYKTSEHRAYMESCGADVRLAMHRGDFPREPLKGFVNLLIRWYRPNRRKADADNPMKAIFDGLQYARALDNDFQVCDFSMSRRYSKENPRLELVFVPVFEDPDARE